MNFAFIGDIHGNFNKLRSILNTLPCDMHCIQLGDMGIGFDSRLDSEYRNIKIEYPNIQFIRGNHDNPRTCQDMPGYLGDFGYIEANQLFYIGGGYSVDKMYRTEGKTWWPEEEFNYIQMSEVMSLYKEIKPKYIITHEGPKCIVSKLLNTNHIIESSTSRFYDCLFEEHKPDKWIFAHYHVNGKFMYKGTEFSCVNMEETALIQIKN